MVLDPFCGCATACVAAEKLDRQWAGIDVSTLAYRLVRQRLAREVYVGSEETPRLTGWNVTHREDIPLRADLGPIPPYNSTQNKEALFGRQRGYCNGCEVPFDYRTSQSITSCRSRRAAAITSTTCSSSALRVTRRRAEDRTPN